MKRAVLYQIILLVLIASVAYLIISVTQGNLQRLGVDSGIDFLWQRAGFEISQTLIRFDADSTIARAFVVALLNTLVLAFASILCASVLGLVVGTARLSRNWLVSRLATAYVETFRNIPALLQVFFWYFVVLSALPRSRDSLELFDSIFLNNRGLFLPAPQIEAGAGWLAGALLAASAGAVTLGRWARRRRAGPVNEILRLYQFMNTAMDRDTRT